MRRIAVFAYGVIVYVAFVASLVYLIGFIGDLFVPRSVDRSLAQGMGDGTALLVDFGLLVFFGFQHSVMARPGFKSWWTRFVPEAAERSTYVLFTVLALVPLFLFWQPIPTVVWHFDEGGMRAALTALYLSGYAIVFASTLLLNHFDLFGLRQVTLYARGKKYEALPFATPAWYRWTRHPLYLGWLIALWATPTMTTGHLLLAGVWTNYILAAMLFEERDLIDHFGEAYRRYQRDVPAFLPMPGRSATRAAEHVRA